MNFEKYTDRARGFVESAQSLALREGHQQFAPEHLLKVLLDDPEGLAAGSDRPLRRQFARSAAGGGGGACQAAESLRRRSRADLSRSGAGARVRRRREGGREGRRQLRHGRAAAAWRWRSRRTARPARFWPRPASPRKISMPPSRPCARAAPRIPLPPKTPMTRSRNMPAISRRPRATASSTPSSAATRKSAAPSRCSRAGPRTIRC